MENDFARKEKAVVYPVGSARLLLYRQNKVVFFDFFRKTGIETLRKKFGGKNLVVAREVIIPQFLVINRAVNARAEKMWKRKRK